MGKVEPSFSQRCILQYIEIAVRARENKIDRVFLIMGSSFLPEQLWHICFGDGKLTWTNNLS